MTVVVERTIARPLAEVWASVSDVAAHRLPLTTVHTDPGPPGVGWRFSGVTALGPLHMRDDMIVTRWLPPGSPESSGSSGSAMSAQYAVVKVGRVLGGWAEVTLSEPRPGWTQVQWREEIVPHPHALGRLARPLVDAAVRAMFSRAVDTMLAQLARP